MSEEVKQEHKLTLIQKLAKVQLELKAPKNQRNNFGGYNYRSAEDILEAVKPLAIKYGAVVNITDDVIQVSNRIYVKAMVRFIDIDDVSQSLATTALAREEETKKGMDGSQITGAASSYARKYALNGMFAIDDTKDSDATNDHGRGGDGQPTAKPVNAGQMMAAAKPKPRVSEKYKEAWKSYVNHESNEGVEPDLLKANFKNLCKQVWGCDKQAANVTDDEWDKVIAAVSELGSDISF